MKTALVLGSSGFIGGHLVKRLKAEGYWVRGVDLVHPKYNQPNEFVSGDLRDPKLVEAVLRFDWDINSAPFMALKPYSFLKQPYCVSRKPDEVYQLAADMGGAGFVFSGDHDADIMHNSAMINLNVAEALKGLPGVKIFYSSSACMYPAHNQTDPDNPKCSEETAYPAAPDSEYGWEKLFSERLYLAYQRNYNLNVRIARFHNIYGPDGTYQGGREKAPAAICRKVFEGENEIQIWGDGKQTRSFLYVNDCVEAVRRLMESDFTGPVNIGSEEMVTINELAEMVMHIAGKKLTVKHIYGPQGVRGRNSDNTLIFEKLLWKPEYTLMDGLKKTYSWIETQMQCENPGKI